MAETQTVEEFKCQARLPTFAAPTRYDLHLRPDLTLCTFTGTVEIDVNVSASTRFLVLNSADLSIDASSVRFRLRGSPDDLRPSEVVAVEEDEILVLGFAGGIPIGEGVLAIAFAGILNDHLKGFYRSTYEHKGENRNMAVTQFEPADARRCFPCWDEPSFKARFKISVEVPSELIALSNMPAVEEKPDHLVKIYSFQESPIMSTYLVAIVVGVFDCIAYVLPDGILVRVYCQVGKTNQGKFALDIAIKTLELYKKYFGVPYPLPKLDMVAIPDFTGAMENYGLVTYQETCLLYDENHSSASSKQDVAITVAHELAHQWFGNLVTMEWWSHLWLNEGFATWMSFLAIDSLFPQWKIWTQFLGSTASGLRLDALAESHPIEVNVNHANEIDEIFDEISYSKGASVIQMLQSYLGASCFQRSLASYIERYAYSNARTEDLWAVLEKESGEPVTTIMNSWTKQKGYPVVNVTIKDNKLEFEQSHFLSCGSSDDRQWVIPITLCLSTYDIQNKFLLKTKNEVLDMAKLVGSSIDQDKSNKGNDKCFWIKLNVDQTGFYRVKYDDELSAKLRYAISSNQLCATDRYGILDDAYALCVAGKQTLSSLLSLMNSYMEETDYTVMSHLISVSHHIVNIAGDASAELFDKIKEFVIRLLQASVDKLGWDPKVGESDLETMLRGEILCVLAKFNHDVTLTEAINRFNAFLADRNSSRLPPDTRKVAYLAVMKTVNASNRSGYESLLSIYRETDQSEEKIRILASLASCPDEDIILEALNFLLTSEVRNKDVICGLHGISREGRETAWKWLKEKWDDYISKIWGSGFLISNIIKAIVPKFTSIEKADEVEAFFATRMKPSFSRSLKQSLERIQINSNWVESIRRDYSLQQVLKS